MKRNTKMTDTVIIIVMMLLAVLLIVFVHNKTSVKPDQATQTVETSSRSVTEYNGRPIGIKTGSSYEKMTFSKFPDSEYQYYDTTSDLVAALQSGKIDAFMEDEPVARYVQREQPDLCYLRELVYREEYSFAFKKNSGDKLRNFNAFIAKCKADGSLDALAAKWLDGAESGKVLPDYPSTGENGPLIVTIQSDFVPISYIKDNQLVGFAVELASRFASEYSYEIQFEDCTVPGCIAGITTGKYDILAGTVSSTEERKQSMDFSDPFYSGGTTLLVRNETAAAVESSDSFFDMIAQSFEKNFIREDRWMLIVEGILTTCHITVLSALFGSVIAFLLCLLRRTGSRLANTLINGYVKLLQGTPLVVLLMILYYVIFGQSSIPAVWVAVIGFTLNFAAYTSEIMRSGLESIDNGQREAALALGFTENQAFFRFIFPQAAVRFLPVYRGEIVSLLKSTSIVGYIAIADLTKMSDIIRSRTYEAFFPLIATALIYFLLAWLLSLLLGMLLKRIDPKKHNPTRKADA